MLARGGDLVALDELLSRLRPEFIRLARRLAGRRLSGRVELDDLFQDSAIHVLGSIRSMRATNLSGFRAWFRGIMHHRVLALVHEARPRVRPRLSMALPDDVVSYHAPDQMPESEDGAAMTIREDLGTIEETRDDVRVLVPDHRISLVLHDVFGTELETMAFLIGRSNRTSARATRRRALSKLIDARRPTDSLRRGSGS